MKFDIHISIAENFIKPKAHIIYELSRELDRYFQQKTYCDNVDEIYVGLLMTLIRPGYEDWYKPKRPRYIEAMDGKSKITGETISVRKRLNLEFLLSENEIGQFLNGNDYNSKQFILDYIIIQLQQIKLPAKISDFSIEDCLKDFGHFNL